VRTGDRTTPIINDCMKRMHNIIGVGQSRITFNLIIEKANYLCCLLYRCWFKMVFINLDVCVFFNAYEYYFNTLKMSTAM